MDENYNGTTPGPEQDTPNVAHDSNNQYYTNTNEHYVPGSNQNYQNPMNQSPQEDVYAPLTEKDVTAPEESVNPEQHYQNNYQAPNYNQGGQQYYNNQQPNNQGAAYQPPSYNNQQNQQYNHQEPVYKGQGSYQNNQGGQQYYQSNNHLYQPQEKTPGLSIASMVLGIISILGSCACYGVPSLIMSVLAIIFSFLSKDSQGRLNSYSKAGLITGIIGIVMAVIMFIFIAIVIGSSSSSYYNDFYRNF